MVGKDRRVRHLPERVLRQYGYVQTIPRPPIDIGHLAATDVARAFMEYALHVLSQQERGELVPVPDNESWSASWGYMRWFVRVSHPIVNPPVAIPDYTANAHPRLVPPYEEVLVEQQWARHPPNPYQIISNIRARVDSAMGHPNVFGNPKVLRVMQGIQYEWSRCQLHGGGVGVDGMERYDFCSFFYDFLLDLVVNLLHLLFLAFL